MTQSQKLAEELESHIKYGFSELAERARIKIYQRFADCEEMIKVFKALKQLSFGKISEVGTLSFAINSNLKYYQSEADILKATGVVK